MAQVRYIGPHTEGVLVSVIGDWEEYDVPHGEVVELPDRLVHGYVPEMDGDEIVTAGGAGLNPEHWEILDAPSEPEPETPEGASA